VPEPTPGTSSSGDLGKPAAHKGSNLKPVVTKKSQLSEAAKRIVDSFAAKVAVPPNSEASTDPNPKVRLQLSDYLKNKSFAKVSRPPLLTVFQTDYSQHPVSMANFLALRNFITTHQSAAILGADEEGEDPPDLSFEILPLDRETRGMPIQPDNIYSQRWLEELINDIEIEGTSFKTWLPGERPQNFAMEVYLHSDHDGLTEEQVIRLLKHLNKQPPLPVDFRLQEIKQQLDRQGQQKGRVATLQAGPNFYSYCKNHGWKLKFPGGTVPCITQEDKSRNFQQQKKRGNATNPESDNGKKPKDPNNKKPKGGK
jgi:hypothetical protein